MMNKKNSDLNTQSVLSMRSDGYYSERTIGAKIAIDSSLPLMNQAIKEIPTSNILRMADFGSADGGTSQEMWFKIFLSKLFNFSYFSQAYKSSDVSPLWTQNRC